MLRRFFIVFLFSLITLCVADECGERSFKKYLVVGGTQSSPGEWPWLASLHYLKTNNYFCGSSLISNDLLVTGEFY